MLKLALQLMENDHIGAAVSHVGTAGSARPSSRWAERRNVRSGLLRKKIEAKEQDCCKIKTKTIQKNKVHPSAHHERPTKRAAGPHVRPSRGSARSADWPHPCVLLQHQLNQGPAAALVLNLIRCRPART